MIINKNIWAGTYGIARKLNVAKHPAAVMGKPVKYPLLSVTLKRANLNAPQAI
jgi:hypothetical protein